VKRVWREEGRKRGARSISTVRCSVVSVRSAKKRDTLAAVAVVAALSEDLREATLCVSFVSVFVCGKKALPFSCVSGPQETEGS